MTLGNLNIFWWAEQLFWVLMCSQKLAMVINRSADKVQYSRMTFKKNVNEIEEML
jgi:hypothetical protein